MRVLVCGYAFWLFSILILLRLVLSGSVWKQPAARANSVLFLGLLVLGAFLLFRPHEDIFGGQDGGAYLNTAARLARQPRLSYVDPLLKLCPPKARDLFLYYGSNRPYLSKYACGQIKDFDRSICGVWFQPAYPIVASIAGRWFASRAILYVIPLFALLIAISLRELFAELWPDAASLGNAAAFLFLINPLVVWHARHPRPEVIASFLLISGATLLLRAWRHTDSLSAFADVFLGSTALALAPFFHITAWMVLIPAAVSVAAAILAGRTTFLVHPLISYAGLRLFIWQLQHITDTYGLLRRAPWLAARPWIQTLLFAILLILLTILSYRTRKAKSWLVQMGRFAPAGTAMALTVGYGLCWYLARLNPPTKQWPPVHHYMYRTDIPALFNFFSRPVALLIFAGFLFMALSARPNRAARLVILWAMVPATLLIGNFYDFFITRYLLVSFLPLAALSLATLPALFTYHSARYARSVAAATTLLLAALLTRNRVHLIQTVEYQGLQKFIHQLARPILREGGILLFEYPRLAAPFDLMFGVPTLALHNERDDDYALQERAWASIMHQFTNRPAYFITPFQTPRSDRFHFVPIGSAAYTGSFLVQKRWDLPTDVRDWTVDLRVYRMLSAKDPMAPTPSFPDVFELGDGNMGLRRFARVRQKPRETDAIRLDPDRPLAIRPDTALSTCRDLLVFLLITNTVPDLTVTLATDSVHLQAKPEHIVNEWWFARFPSPQIADSNNGFQISVTGPALLHDILALDANDCVPLLAARTDLPKERILLQSMFTRWARQDAQVCVPVSTEPTLLLVFHTAPDELNTPLALTAASPELLSAGPRILPPGRWMWTAWALDPQEKAAWRWVTFHAEPVFDPQMRGYPPDLITHFGWVCVYPQRK